MQIIKTTTKDGLKYSGMLFTPTKPTKNIIIHIHGMSGDIYSNSFYPAMHENYPKNGWSFLVGEHRGTNSITQFNTKDGLRNIGNAYEIFEDCIYDIDAWVNKAIELGYENIWLQSHSLGPSKVAYYIHKTKDKRIKGLIFLSPADMTGVGKDPKDIENIKNYLIEAKKLTKDGKENNLLEGNLWGCMKFSAKTYINFFGENTNLGIFNFEVPSKSFKVINSINLPVISFTGTKDDGICLYADPYKAMKILEKELINSSRKKTIVFKDGNHDFEGFGEEITKEVLKFIENK